ncbi:MAG: lipase family protein [Caulobacteraceae bacterium]
MLSTLDVAANTDYKEPIMYNFGSPRVGNPKFVQIYNEVVRDSFRIVNVNDIVPTLPPVTVRSPLSSELRYYVHVNEVFQVSVQTGSIQGNHIVENYLKGLECL